MTPRPPAGAAFEGKEQRRSFILVQAAKALVGALLSAGFVAFVGVPSRAEAIAIAGLLAPLGLMGLGFTRLPLSLLEQAGLVLFALLIGYLAALTGGVTSPLVVWLALVPAEAALAGGRSAAMRAAAASCAALIAVAAVEAAGHLPVTDLALALGPIPVWEIYAASVLAAVVQAGLIAVATQDHKLSADRAAAEGAALYRFLADHAMDLVTRHSADGRIRFASPPCNALLGRTPDEIVGLSLSALVHGEDLKAVQSAFTEASYFGRAARIEVRLRHRDNNYVWTEICCHPAALMPGDVADIVAVTRDISERKAHERALIEARDAALSASRAKSRFLANMSHELRTPLNAIIGFSEVMTREMFGPLGSARYQEYSRLIHESGGHLLELINGVLDMSKIEAGKFELYEEVFGLEDVVESAVRFVRMQAERGGVVLRTQIAPEARTIFADKRAVKQMLVNLLSNGVKFTPRGGEVRVLASVNARGLELAVLDTGMGIAPADLVRLGQPFEQARGEQTKGGRARAKDGPEGTGLGLALVKGLAAMHGGEALLESVLGEGTSVRVRLPYAVVDAKGERQTPQTHQAKILPFRGAA